MNTAIREFFDNHILPLHVEGKIKLDMHSDNNAASYFTKPLYPDFLYLDTIPFENAAALKQYLEKLWHDEAGLVASIPELVELVFKMKEEHKEESAELSPFIYAMF